MPLSQLLEFPGHPWHFLDYRSITSVYASIPTWLSPSFCVFVSKCPLFIRTQVIVDSGPTLLQWDLI